jgi:hypothetical protein
MDADLSELRRQRDADPGDADAARRYEAALLRAGRRDELERLYAFEFRCDQDWNAMQPTAEPGARDCAKCRKTVHSVSTREELERRVREGACVSFDPGQVDALAFLIDDGDVTAAQGRGLCLVEGGAPDPLRALGPVEAERLTGKPRRLPDPSGPLRWLVRRILGKGD